MSFSMAFVPTKHLFLASLLLLVFGSSAPRATSSRLLAEDDVLLVQQHEQWMANHGRVYKDEAEKAARLKIFKSNLQYIESFNREGGHKYKLGVTVFADLTNEEFNSMINSSRYAPTDPKGTVSTSFMYENLTDAPESVDWRLNNAVTPVKNQGACGCCWAFAAVAAMEAVVKMKTGDLISLSEQQLLDCDGSYDGCSGGSAAVAFEFIKENGGLTTEEKYPYQAVDNNACDTVRAASVAASIVGYQPVSPVNDEGTLLKAVANQPVYASIVAGSQNFQHYAGGVFGDYCGDSNHAVAVIGYGTEDNGDNYWLVKNSWGTSWGEGGFGKISREVANEQGVCNILRRTTFPIA